MWCQLVGVLDTHNDTHRNTHRGTHRNNTKLDSTHR
jgi:hypothetical protein